MTQKEADEIVLGMGCHPYSRLAMIDALLEGEKIGKEEQKAIDDAELARLKKAWEKEAEVNHDAAMAYKQGYHDAAEHILSQLQDDYDTQSKQDGYKVTCMVSKRHTPQERYERHQGFLSGILVALGYAKKAMEGEQ